MSNRRAQVQFCTRIIVLFTAVAMMAGSGYSQSASSQTSSSSFLANAQNLGAEDASKEISVTVWLQLRNKAALDSMVRDIYDTNSPNYHHFLTREQYRSQFAPSAQDAGTVRAYLSSNKLNVTSIEKNNHYVTATGKIVDIQRAFNVQINRFMVNGTVHRINMSEASVAGSAGALIATVQGLNDFKYSSYAKRSVNPDTGKPYRGVPLSSIGSDGLVFSQQCLRAPEAHIFTTGGGTPFAVYSGNRYGQDLGTPPPNAPSCGYDANEIQTVYGLNALYKTGWDGTGQTIVIVDAFGSNTITADANEFSTINGLPPLTSKNFQIFTPTGPVTCDNSPGGCIAGNWEYETTLDVEWAHAIAPGANIALVLGTDPNFSTLDEANLFAIDNLLGNVISNSFGIPEVVLVDFLPSELVVSNNLAELAAALGISQQVSTGDSGDNLIVDKNDFGINATSPGSAADSPFVTAVGGTSTFLNSDNSLNFQTGWGFNEARIANPTPNPPTIPPLLFGFLSGSGGGESAVFLKPKFQKKLPGKFRQTPDISMNADPETGNEIVISDPNFKGSPTLVEVFGGTSLSCPMFSALWAIANQAAGVPLGEAAPLLYELPAGSILDVVPVTSPFNVTGTIFNPPNPPLFESANSLATPEGKTKLYLSALFQSSSSTRWDVFTFGTDSSLFTAPGWDNVTGLGTPNGLSFINAVVALTKAPSN
jgi:subtilase family serine protease